MTDNTTNITGALTHIQGPEIDKKRQAVFIEALDRICEEYKEAFEALGDQRNG